MRVNTPVAGEPLRAAPSSPLSQGRMRVVHVSSKLWFHDRPCLLCQLIPHRAAVPRRARRGPGQAEAARRRPARWRGGLQSTAVPPFRTHFAVHAAQELCGGELQGGAIGSTEFTLEPRALRCGAHVADTRTAGSCTLLAQVRHASPRHLQFRIYGYRFSIYARGIAPADRVASTPPIVA